MIAITLPYMLLLVALLQTKSLGIKPSAVIEVVDSMTWLYRPTNVLVKVKGDSGDEETAAEDVKQLLYKSVPALKFYAHLVKKLKENLGTAVVAITDDKPLPFQVGSEPNKAVIEAGVYCHVVFPKMYVT